MLNFKESFRKGFEEGKELGCKAARKCGYGVGYATETAVLEAKELASKIPNTALVEEAKAGFAEGKSSAEADFAKRLANKASNREAKATEELFTEVFSK